MSAHIGSESLKLMDRLGRRPTASQLREQGILKDPDWARERHQSALDLDKKLSSRPPPQALVELNILRAGAHADPLIQVVSAEVVKRREKDHLSR